MRRPSAGRPSRIAVPAFLLLVAWAASGCRHSVAAQLPAAPVLVIHGGAGVPSKSELTPESDNAYREGLAEALRAGHAVLERGGSALDAVTAAVRVMEDNPLFNAGRGAALNEQGVAELDSSVMDGATRRAGAVAGVRTVRNPVDAARRVAERTPHVLLAGAGAEAFAAAQGLPVVTNGYFVTEARRRQLQEVLEARNRRASLPASIGFGTVGAVALDRDGHLAAATSTGGLAGKMPGRVGDSPLPGAGTWADDATCAVSCTGQGEFFIRYAVAHEIAARIEHAGRDVVSAADSVIRGTLVEAGGEGACIALDRRGRFAMPYNSEGLFRGWIGADGVVHTAIHEH